MLDAVEALAPEQYTKDLGNSFASVRDTVVHIYASEWNWYHRWIGTSPTSMRDPAQFPDVNSVRMAWRSQEEKVRLFVGSIGDANLSRVFEYRQMNGEHAKSVFWHMLQHLVNHASYHRGQITTMLRQLGATPIGTDMSRFYLDRAAGK